MTRFTIVAALAAAACTTVPAKPDWQTDVLPVIASNCAKCHGYPSAFGAPAGFRLDAYDDATIVDDNGLIVHGASTMYFRIQQRIDDGTMPPALPLTGDDQAILDNWANEAIPDNPSATGGTPYTFPPRTGPRPMNDKPPTITVTATATAGVVHYVIVDAEHELVEGQLQVGTVVIARHLRAGQGDVTLDLSQVPDGTGQQVDAVLDDGLPAMQTGVFSVDVTGNGAMPLAITFKHPAPLDFVAEADAAQVDVCANQTVSADVFAIAEQGGAMAKLDATAYTVPLCVAGPSPTTLPLAPLFLQAKPGISDWRIEVVPIGDPAQTARSPKFRVQHGAASGHFADVKDLIASTCAGTCHHDCSPFPATLPYDFNDYTDSSVRASRCGGFLGVGAAKGLIYDHVVVRQDMPPGDPQPGETLADSDRSAITAWFEGGAQQ
jgi:hypothetical protein